MKQVCSGEFRLGLLQHCITAYNQLIVGDTQVLGQRLKMHYECTIGHVS